ncbi:MAG: nucleotidyltransferase domain-containing protein [Defluviitaleaceae bacterium]|nr:nucleotidyltransferase domain-containing protein [Defluviitaleaceae bacterium]MCL2273672.1 nucleotidyltransferase domain-containing protein [Defluviitaleaceae bacterium]
MLDAKLELKNITDEISHNTRNIFGDKLRKIILYGSYARGDYNVYSDLDIMVLADFDESEHAELQSQICKIASRTSIDHDITVCISLNNDTLFMNRLEISPYYQNVMSEGVKLYETT